MNLSIAARVAAARRGDNPNVIARLASGWLVIGDVQPLPGYCMLLADPVVSGPNALDPAARARYFLDTLATGDALIAVAGASRINYETLCNLDPSLHTHITPRFLGEPEAQGRERPTLAYDWAGARAFDPAIDHSLMNRLRLWLKSAGVAAD